MGLKNKSNLQTAQTAARVIFDEVMNAASMSPVVEVLAERYSTGSKNDELPFASVLTTVREWVGAKQVGSFEAFTQSVELKKFEHTFSLDRFDLDYDNPEVVGRALRSAIAASAGFDEKLLFDALVSASGEGPTGFDGETLIGDAHTLAAESQDNKTTSALSFATYDTAVQAMQGFVRANGEPMEIFPTHLIVGPKLRKMALEIAGNAERILPVDNTGAEGGTVVAASTIGNVFKGDNINVIVWNRLVGTQDDYWYLVDASKPVKPMMIKQERDWTLVERTDLDSDPRFELDRLEWSIEADKAYVAGLPYLIYGGIVA